MFQLTRPRGARRHHFHHRLHPPDVSTHAPARGATAAHEHGDSKLAGFNSRAREGRDPAQVSTAQVSPVFQLTRPRGARRDSHGCAQYGRCVSTHAPARGATSTVAHEPSVLDCFNSRAREGRDKVTTLLHNEFAVSTHAPARGATWGLPCLLLTGSLVSTHAPARGATRATAGAKIIGKVSTHAPARGATGLAVPSALNVGCFNSRAREGRDADAPTPQRGSPKFQLTRPRGARPAGLGG